MATNDKSARTVLAAARTATLTAARQAGRDSADAARAIGQEPDIEALWSMEMDSGHWGDILAVISERQARAAKGR